MLVFKDDWTTLETTLDLMTASIGPHDGFYWTSSGRTLGSNNLGFSWIAWILIMRSKRVSFKGVFNGHIVYIYIGGWGIPWTKDDYCALDKTKGASDWTTYSPE